MEAYLESAILIALHNFFKSHPGSPKMTFTELYEAIGVSSQDKEKVAEVWNQFFSLRKKGWLEYQSLAGGQGGTAEVTPEGNKVAQDMQQFTAPTPNLKPSKSQYEDESEETVDEVDTLKAYITSLDDLIREDPDCACLIQRDELLQKIIKRFDETPDEHHVIVLNGQPLVGKTRLLYRLCEALDDKYVPLMVTEQGLELNNTLDDFDAFVFDLADQLTNRFRKWAKRHGLSILDNPEWNDFKGKGNTAFETHWDNLRQIAGKRQPLVIFDEIERLLDFEELDPQILTFLDHFVYDPNNGYFILAGSERIRFSMNEQFSRLIARGESIRVNHHDEKTVHTIFSKVQKHLAYEDQALRHFIALCDGHPRILSYMLDTTFALASRPPGKQRIEKRDIEPILTTVLERIDNSLWLLRLRLSQEELAVVWLISQTIPSLIDRLEYSLHGLVDLADQYLISSTADRNDSASVQRVDATFEESASEKHLIQEPLSIFQSIPPERLYDLIEEGTANLEAREWIEWQNWNERLFCFRLGIFPLWVRRRHIILGKVRH